MLNKKVSSKNFIALFIICAILSCKKEKISSIEVEKEEKKVDYRIYNFSEMASASGSSISDTLWNAKRDMIIGFRLNKKANTEFAYPLINVDKSPFLNSVISLKNLPRYNLDTYKSQSGTMVPRILINTYEPGFSVKNVAINSWADVNTLVQNRVEQLKEDRTGIRDFIFQFHDYNNLQLLFGEEVNIKMLFNINNISYPSLTNTGVLYYYERPTVSLNSLFEDKDFTDHFPLLELQEKNIARVNQIKFGKIGYMAVDIPDKYKPLFSRISSTATFTDKEISDINSIEAHFLLRGFEETDLERLNQLKTTYEKVKEFKTIMGQSSYKAKTIGIPLYYSFKSHSQTLNSFNAMSYNWQINSNK